MGISSSIHQIYLFQTPASGFPGIEDDLVFSGAGSGCNGDDEDECPPLPDNGSGDDDLITPVYIPPTRPPPTVKSHKKPDTDDVTTPCDDDDDCVPGSGSGEVTEESTTTGSQGVISGWFTMVKCLWEMEVVFSLTM